MSCCCDGSLLPFLPCRVVGMSDKGIPVEFEGENGRVMKGVLRLGLLGG